MSTLTFPGTRHSQLHHLLATEQWSAVLDAIEQGFPFRVRDLQGQCFVARFFEVAGPATDQLSLSWQSTILEALIARGLGEEALDEAGHRPLSLAIRALRWDMAIRLLDEGHDPAHPGMPGLWEQAFAGLASEKQRLTGAAVRHLGWRFSKTIDCLLDRNIPSPPPASDQPAALDRILASGNDRLARRMITMGLPRSVGQFPSFEYALLGATMSTTFQLFQEEDQAVRLGNATPMEIAHWLDIIASRRDEDLLAMFLQQLTDDVSQSCQPDLAAACLRQGWTVKLGLMVHAGLSLGGVLADGRHLAHAAANHADEDVLTFLRQHCMDFDIGPDPWTGLTPDQAVAARLPGFQVLPATVTPLRRRP